MHNKGFLIGKFYPFHLGHVHLITEAAKRCNHLTVIVCTQLEDVEDFLPGPARYQMMAEYFRGYHNITVIHHHANEPQYPQEHPKFWNIWLKIVLTYTDPRGIDVVFSSEEYGNVFGERLGIAHECIDIDRKAVNISGTLCRENIWQNWSYLPQVTKRAFIKKVAIMGPESAGKTTLTKRLGHYFSCPTVMEYGREYCELVKPDLELTDHCFKLILERHDAAFKLALSQTDHRLIITDTEHITTKIFHDMYVKTPHLVDLDLIETEEVDMRIVLYPDNEPTQDGTRKFIDQDVRMHHTNIIINTLNQRGLPFKILVGDYEQKFKESVRIIDSLFI
jgi:HTH-type transcriptional repressor of NAD biosynthesis genes